MINELRSPEKHAALASGAKAILSCCDGASDSQKPKGLSLLERVGLRVLFLQILRAFSCTGKCWFRSGCLFYAHPPSVLFTPPFPSLTDVQKSHWWISAHHCNCMIFLIADIIEHSHTSVRIFKRVVLIHQFSGFRNDISLHFFECFRLIIRKWFIDEKWFALWKLHKKESSMLISLLLLISFGDSKIFWKFYRSVQRSKQRNVQKWCVIQQSKSAKEDSRDFLVLRFAIFAGIFPCVFFGSLLLVMFSILLSLGKKCVSMENLSGGEESPSINTYDIYMYDCLQRAVCMHMQKCSLHQVCLGHKSFQI